MNSRDYFMLRDESSDALRKLQELPDFKTVREQLPPVPDFAREMSWRAVVDFHRIRPGVSATQPEPWTDSLVGLVDFGEDERRSRSSPPASAERVGQPGPRLESRPSDEESWALSRYEAAVKRFAQRYLFGAALAECALHDALRQDRAIELPEGGGVLVRPGNFLDLRELELSHPMPLESFRAIVDELNDFLTRISTRSLPASRDRTWERVLSLTEARLAAAAHGRKEPKATTAQRKALHDARDYLNAAVTGNQDVLPVEWRRALS